MFAHKLGFFHSNNLTHSRILPLTSFSLGSNRTNRIKNQEFQRCCGKKVEIGLKRCLEVFWVSFKKNFAFTTDKKWVKIVFQGCFGYKGKNDNFWVLNFFCYRQISRTGIKYALEYDLHKFSIGGFLDFF